MMESIARTLRLKVWCPVKPSRRGPSLSHLFFADDFLLFSRATEAQMASIMSCIEVFSNASGLRINFSKSQLFLSPNVSHQLATLLSSSSGIPLT